MLDINVTFGETAAAVDRALANNGASERNGCLDARYLNLRKDIEPVPSLAIVPANYASGHLFSQLPSHRTNFITNNTLVGATGNLLPTGWSVSIPAGLTATYGIAGETIATDDQLVNFIDITITGTASANGTLFIFPNGSNIVSTGLGQSWNASCYFSTSSSGLSSTNATWDIIESNTSSVLETSSVNVSSIALNSLNRLNIGRTITNASSDRIAGRFSHSVVSGTTYNYNIRIASPQLEKGLKARDLIRTSGTLVSVYQSPTNIITQGGDFTVSRNTGATRVGPNGLIEAGNTNLALQSEAFNVTGTWTTLTGGTGVAPVVTQATGIVDPAGGTTAERIQLSVGSGTFSTDFSILRQTVTFTAVAHTFSVYLRSATSASQFVAIRFDSAPQTILEITPSWQRFTFTGTPIAGSRDFGFDLRGNNTSASGSADFYAWGAQVEVGSTASEYIPTTTVARTRFAGVTVDGTIAANIPRIDWLGQSCPGLLVEPSAQNLALQSAGFQVSGNWSPTNITVTTGSTAAFTAPDGSTDADLLTSTASGSARIIQSFSFVSGTTYTYSAFAKAGSGFFGLTMENGGVASGAAVIWNLNTGALAVSGVAGTGYTLQSQGIENYGNGWYRCRMTVLMSVSVAGNIRANTSDGTMSSAIINSASGNNVYVWGAQLETGSVATTYIPTTSGTGSRAADVISASGALVSGLIGQTEGVLYIECESNNGEDDVIFVNRSVTNGIALYKNANNAYIGRIYHSSTSIIFQSASGVTGMVKIAIAYKSGDSTMYLNGSRVGTLNTTAITFGAALNYVGVDKSSAFFSGIKPSRIRAAALYTTRLTDAQLAELTRL